MGRGRRQSGSTAEGEHGRERRGNDNKPSLNVLTLDMADVDRDLCSSFLNSLRKNPHEPQERLHLVV